MRTKKQCVAWLDKKAANRTRIDYDKAYGVQCVDGVKAFLAYVRGRRIPALGNGKDVAKNCKRLGYTTKKNTGIYVCSTAPKRSGDYGHTFILVGNYVYEENGTGNNDGYRKVKFDSKFKNSYGKITKYYVGNIKEDTFKVKTFGKEIKAYKNASSLSKVVSKLPIGSIRTIVATKGRWYQTKKGNWLGKKYCKKV